MSARHCSRTSLVQDYLDRLLTPPEDEAFRRHLEDCAACAAEVEAFGRLFSTLERAPLIDPGPRLTERVLAAVVPSRIRRRWLATVGWAYAGSLAACVALVTVVLRVPTASAWLLGASGAASRGGLHLALFALNLLSYATLTAANGWGTVVTLVTRVAPVPRAFVSLLQHPVVELSLAAAAVICFALLAGLRRRERPLPRHIEPLSVWGM